LGQKVRTCECGARARTEIYVRIEITHLLPIGKIAIEFSSWWEFFWVT
jgi:hypothetical protein